MCQGPRAALTDSESLPSATAGARSDRRRLHAPEASRCESRHTTMSFVIQSRRATSRSSLMPAMTLERENLAPVGSGSAQALCNVLTDGQVKQAAATAGTIKPSRIWVRRGVS
jgi:hypothetical protein